MTAIWRNDGNGWKVLQSGGFADEAALHTLVEEAPQMLPLAGQPHLTVLGREVSLANGNADLIAVESSGRLVVIEIKLARNSEARRAVVAQVLSYAASLYQLDIESLEANILARHLRQRDFVSVADAVESGVQDGSFDAATFREGLATSLRNGQFRLVLVLDAAPAELSSVVSYLETISDRVLIDLITISSYDVDGSQVMVPHRVEPERLTSGSVDTQPTRPTGQLSEGSSVFRASFDRATPEDRERLEQLAAWAEELLARNLITLESYTGVRERVTLLPRVQPDNVGLVTVWHENGASIQVWRSVFERMAPESLARLEDKLGSDSIRQGNYLAEFDTEVLALLTAAYEEAARRG